jgi:hypothetical protein
VLKVTAVEWDVIDRKFEIFALTLVLAPAKNGDEAQLPVVVVVVVVAAAAAAAAVAVIAVAEAGGLAPYNAEPIPSLCLPDWDCRLPFLQKL